MFWIVLRRSSLLIVAVSIALLPWKGIIAQTQVSSPKNDFNIEEDVRLGREAAAEIEKKFPLIVNLESKRYLEDVGSRLIAAIPVRFRQPAFEYSFKIINASDINAFALPGGPIYLNRGMIESAANEGEMAGVMAHEIAHVGLRHGTAKATLRNSPLNQIIGIGAILGGAILGGETGAEIGAALFASFALLPYSREHETSADILGAQIMADAGYDPRDLARIFQTIERKSGKSEGPDWLSTHPSSNKRFEEIGNEARMLNVSPNPIKLTPGFSAIKSFLLNLPPTKTTEEIEKEADTADNPMSQGTYEMVVPPPSKRTARIRGGNWIAMDLPSNWQTFQGEIGFEAAPEGAFGDKGITHGVSVGTFKGKGVSLAADTDDFISSLLMDNPYLEKQWTQKRAVLGGQAARLVNLSGRSPITRQIELVEVRGTRLRTGELGYVITVVPRQEELRYTAAFRSILESVRIF